LRIFGNFWKFLELLGTSFDQQKKRSCFKKIFYFNQTFDFTKKYQLYFLEKIEIQN